MQHDIETWKVAPAYPEGRENVCSGEREGKKRKKKKSPPKKNTRVE